MEKLKQLTPADLAQAMNDEIIHFNELLKEIRLIRLQERRLHFLHERTTRHFALQHATPSRKK